MTCLVLKYLRLSSQVNKNIYACKYYYNNFSQSLPTGTYSVSTRNHIDMICAAFERSLIHNSFLTLYPPQQPLDDHGAPTLFTVTSLSSPSHHHILYGHPCSRQQPPSSVRVLIFFVAYILLSELASSIYRCFAGLTSLACLLEQLTSTFSLFCMHRELPTGQPVIPSVLTSVIPTDRPVIPPFYQYVITSMST